MIKVINTPVLLRLNLASKKLNANNPLLPGTADLVDPAGIHLLESIMMTGPFMRCKAVLKFTGRQEPAEGMFDVPVRDFLALPDERELKKAQLILNRGISSLSFSLCMAITGRSIQWPITNSSRDSWSAAGTTGHFTNQRMNAGWPWTRYSRTACCAINVRPVLSASLARPMATSIVFNARVVIRSICVCGTRPQRRSAL